MAIHETQNKLALAYSNPSYLLYSKTQVIQSTYGGWFTQGISSAPRAYPAPPFRLLFRHLSGRTAVALGP